VPNQDPDPTDLVVRSDAGASPRTGPAPEPKGSTKKTRPANQSRLPLSDLTRPERAVHDAIIADEDLVGIVRGPEKLARDLVRVGPGVDVAGEVAKSGAWLRANPARRKSNGNKFLLAWVTRQQERFGGRGVPSQEPEDEIDQRPHGPPQLEEPWHELLNLVPPPKVANGEPS
jgi:hypothetical protein